MQPDRPLALLAELTHACPLRCAYCSNPLELVRRSRELDTATWKRVLAEAARLGVIQVHFSGGEPLLRADLAELVAAAVRVGLYPYLVTSAVPNGAAALAPLWSAGLRAVQISVQDATAERSDALAGAASFATKRAAALEARRLSYHVTLNVVLERRNVEHVAELAELAYAWGARKLELAHAQSTGWAFSNRSALAPSAAQIEAARVQVARARSRYAEVLEIVHVLPGGVGELPRACLQGWGRRFLTIAPDGTALPCQSARAIAGLEHASVRDAALDWIWNESPAFQRFRGTAWMREPCRSCEHRERDLGGCRCQAFLVAGDASATDPACPLSEWHERFARGAAGGSASELVRRGERSVRS